jgi:archaellum component FlaC
MRINLRTAFKKITMPGWAILIYGAINAASNIEFVAEKAKKMQPLFEFLTTPLGNTLLIILGIAWIVLVASRKPKAATPESISISEADLNTEQTRGIKELNDRIRELEGEKSSLEIERKQDAKSIEHYRTKAERLEKNYLDIDVLYRDRDSRLNNLIAQYSWLHELADAQMVNISQYVELESILLTDVRLTDINPTVTFVLKVRNISVFDITINRSELSGYLVFMDLRLRGQITMTGSTIHDMQYNGRGELTLEQCLNPGEAEHISNNQNEPDSYFYFDKLYIPINGGKRFPEVERGCLLITTNVIMNQRHSKGRIVHPFGR